MCKNSLCINPKNLFISLFFFTKAEAKAIRRGGGETIYHLLFTSYFLSRVSQLADRGSSSQRLGTSYHLTLTSYASTKCSAQRLLPFTNYCLLLTIYHLPITVFTTYCSQFSVLSAFLASLTKTSSIFEALYCSFNSVGVPIASILPSTIIESLSQYSASSI